MEETPLTVEGQMGVIEQPEQPQGLPQPAFQPAPALDEAAVRAAVIQAEQTGQNPAELRIGDLGQPAQQAKAPVDVPEKFKKPNGEVDVEKLNASTKQLDEAIQEKQAKVQDVGKFVEEALKAYKEKEKQFRTLPNPEKLAAQIPQPQAPVNPQQLSDSQIEQMIAADLQANPARTVAQLVQLALARELAPLQEERKDNQIRENLKKLAETDPRVVANMAQINAKLEADPDLWKLRNPHRAAWLEVREELRLGEPSPAQAQPSKPVAPVLGGGTPPPAPSSSSGKVDVNTLLQATKQIAADPRNAPKKYDSKDWNKLDQLAKSLFDQR